MPSTSHPLDELDWAIIRALQADGRLSFNQLARLVHLSAPAVAERVRRLEQAQIITGYSAQIDAKAVGQPLLAFVQLRCTLGKCLLKTTKSEDFPEIVEIHKLSSEHCTMLKVRATSLLHLEGVIDRLGSHGEMRTDLVLSTQYDHRTVEPFPLDDRTVPAAPGWQDDGPGDRLTRSTRRRAAESAEPSSSRESP